MSTTPVETPSVLREDTESFPDDEELCVATVDDMEAVMAIDRNVYQGEDYLQTMYADHVTGPGMTGYLYKKEGKVVGFLSVQLMDAGQTLLTCAGRIAEECRGGGMYGRFTRRVFRQYRHLPDVRHIVMTVNNLNLATTGHKLLKTYNYVMETLMTNVDMDIPETKSKVSKQTGDVQGVRQLSRGEVHQVISRQPSQLTHFFPHGWIILSWKPYRVMAANADLILPAETNRVFVTSVETSANSSLQASGKETFLSCGSYFFCKLGVRYAIDVFGSGSDEDLRAHVEWHLLRCVSVADVKEALVHVYYRRTVERVVDSLREMYPVKPSDWPYKKVTLVEADYERLL